MTGRDPTDEPTDDDSAGGIEVAGVEKSYGEVAALRDVSLSIPPGTIHGLVGPNGSGKTTLFRVLLGLARPDAGSVSMPDSTVGCGFQEPRCYDDLTVYENLDVFASLAGASGDRVEELLDVFGLDDVRDHLASDLSGGQAKKLDLALAFVDRPAVVLLDEPFADLDDASKESLLEFLEGYVTGDRILVLTTHQLTAFEGLLDAVTVLDRGRVVLDVAASAFADDLRGVYRGTIEERDDRTPLDGGDESGPPGDGRA